MKKILIGAVVAVVVVIVAAVLVVGFFLDGIVKKGIETVGPQVTKVDIKLDSVHLSLLGGSARVKGLVVGNPEGYKSPQAISVGSAHVAVRPGSVLSDKVVVKSIVVESPEITFEGGPLKNNLTAIMDNVNAAAGAEKSTESKPGETAPAKKLQVDEFKITGAKVHIVGGPTIPLPDISLANLGTGSEGITPADLTQRVLSALVTGTLKAVADTGISEVGKQATEAVGGAVDKVGKSIGDLFKKK
ncbi:MAG TPA: AsmA family protein [Verrucomicrobiota bacterium]|nr:AsmA family protein [Verrucomicrobiota bacterium]